MNSESTIVKGWALSTESKITSFVDEYLINYPQKNVRESTLKLITSLFRKGTFQAIQEARHNAPTLSTYSSKESRF